MFNDRLEVHNNTMIKIQHTWHTHITMGDRRGVGGRGGENRCLPPPLENYAFFFALWVAF